MEKKRVRVKNLTSHKVTVNLTDFNGRKIVVMPKLTGILTEEELAYVMNTSKVFQKGTLKVENKESLSEDIFVEDLESKNALSDEDIKAILGKAQKTIKKELDGIDNIHVAKRMLTVANELDKSVKVIDMIEARIEDLLG